MNILWSASTTMRNPERTYNFLKTIAEIEGKEWNKETQMMLQALLIKNRYYVPTISGLSESQIAILDNLEYTMSYDEARDIFDSKNYQDPPMRGRTSFDPLEKMGLVQLNTEVVDAKTIKVVRITQLGRMFLNEEISLGDLVFSYLLKFQYPNPLTTDCSDYNTKPFINALRLIKRANEIAEAEGMTVKGVSLDEFGIFVLSIKSYEEVENKAYDLINFRKKYEKLSTFKEKKEFRDSFVASYLSDFVEPVKNTIEYCDNIVRYLRLTKYIYMRGGNRYVDLEPRRKIEIDALLENDNGSAILFTEKEYKDYISDYYAYELPFETKEKLKDIASLVAEEISNIMHELSLPGTLDVEIADSIPELKKQIENLREERTKLQTLELRHEFENIDKIDETIESLKNIKKLGIKPSIALEKFASISLNIIDDAIAIKPNAPMGDDNEPTFTAPPGLPDIECKYTGFGMICEVTMLTGRDQWFNEGQPVMRHLRDFEDRNEDDQSYCLFVAPSLHQDTLNTFWNAVKYEYQGRKQRIIPLTINQLIMILEGIKEAKLLDKKITYKDMEQLYCECSDILKLSDSTQWQGHVTTQINNWRLSFAA